MEDLPSQPQLQLQNIYLLEWLSHPYLSKLLHNIGSNCFFFKSSALMLSLYCRWWYLGSNFLSCLDLSIHLSNGGFLPEVSIFDIRRIRSTGLWLEVGKDWSSVRSVRSFSTMLSGGMVASSSLVRVNLYLFAFHLSLLLCLLVFLGASHSILLTRVLLGSSILCQLVLRFDMVGCCQGQSILKFKLNEGGRFDDFHEILDLILECWEAFHLLLQLMELMSWICFWHM